MLLAVRLGPVSLVVLLSGSLVLSACARADEPEGPSGFASDASTTDAGGAAGEGGAAGSAGVAGTGAGAGQGGAAGAAGASGASAGSGGTGGTGYAGTGGYGGTGGIGFGGSGGEVDAGIPCGGQLCTDWVCEKTGIGLSIDVLGCCQQTNECGAVNSQGSGLCLPVEAVEQLLDVTCKPD